MSSDSSLAGLTSPSPFTADQGAHLDVPAPLHSCTAEGHHAQDRDHSIWQRKLDGELVLRNKVVTKTRSEENCWQMKLLFDKQFKQEEYLAECFQRTVLDS